jgi:hypothetical protein
VRLEPVPDRPRVRVLGHRRALPERRARVARLPGGEEVAERRGRGRAGARLGARERAALDDEAGRAGGGESALELLVECAPGEVRARDVVRARAERRFEESFAVDPVIQLLNVEEEAGVHL